MSNLQHRQDKIQEKRKQTPWREFVMELGSRNTVNIYRNHGKLSRYPETAREGSIVDIDGYDPQEIISMNYQGGSIFPLITELFQQQPKMRLMQWFENENSDYAEVYGGKNCYLSIGVGGIENTAYSLTSYGNLTNIYNAFSILGNCSNIYSSRIVTDSYNIFYSSNIHNSSNIWFSSNLIGCHDCILCDNLDNQSYCINNQQLSAQEYNTKKQEILSKQSMFDTHHKSVLRNIIHNKVSSNCSGAGIVSSSDIEHGYFVRNMSHGRNLVVGGGDLSTQNFYDCFDCGNEGDHDLYAAHYCGENSSHVYCCSSIAHCSHIFYSYFLESCSFCLGCIGLKNKSYCILNKQYTKEEWYQKVDEIFTQMEKDGTLGEFFPASMNPFYFNDTAAYLIDPSFTKEEVVAKGYLWRDEPIKVDVPEWMEVVESKDLGQFEGRKTVGTNSNTSDKQWTIDPVILKKTIRDGEGNIYRVIKMEYDFLIKYGLPLPRKHWLTRMKENFKIS